MHLYISCPTQSRCGFIHVKGYFAYNFHVSILYIQTENVFPEIEVFPEKICFWWPKNVLTFERKDQSANKEYLHECKEECVEVGNCVYSSIQAKVRTHGCDSFTTSTGYQSRAVNTLTLIYWHFIKALSEPKQKVNPNNSHNCIQSQRRELELTKCGLDFADSESKNLYSAITQYVETGQSYKYTERWEERVTTQLEWPLTWPLNINPVSESVHQRRLTERKHKCHFLFKKKK